MKGIIDKIEKKPTKTGKEFHLLTVDGERYSVWESKLVKGLSEGDQIEFEWDKSGDFKKMTSLKSGGGNNSTPSQTGKFNNNPKSMYFAYGKDVVVALINVDPQTWKKKNLESIASAITTIALSLYSASEGERKSPPVEKDESPKSNQFEDLKKMAEETDWGGEADIDVWLVENQEAIQGCTTGQQRILLAVADKEKNKLKK